MSKNLLFVCKHNRFRSKVAEAFFNKYNKNKNYKAYGAGLLPGRYPLDEIQVKVAKEFGINLKGKPKPITTDLLRKTDFLIIVADNVPPEIFDSKKYGKKEEIWNIQDTVNDEEGEVRQIILKIEKKVIEFVKELK